MSWDARIGDYDWNYTSNMIHMLRRAGWRSMTDLNELTGQDAAKKIDALLDTFKDDPDGYRALNPPNGWGDFDRFVDCLLALRDACEAMPELTLVVEA